MYHYMYFINDVLKSFRLICLKKEMQVKASSSIWNMHPLGGKDFKEEGR